MNDGESQDVAIEVDIPGQTLTLLCGTEQLVSWPVSTARNGPGEKVDSECTPRGTHEICQKIGDGCPVGTVFVGRTASGDVYTPELGLTQPSRDWILTRILWLDGREQGRNLGGDVDSRSRYIYIHGSPDDLTMGSPGSHGCIRMRNADVVELFDRIRVGTKVHIE